MRKYVGEQGLTGLSAALWRAARSTHWRAGGAPGRFGAPALRPVRLWAPGGATMLRPAGKCAPHGVGAPTCRRVAHPALLTGARRHRIAMMAVTAVAVLLVGCRAETLTSEGPLPLGAWGGVQGTLTIFADSATLDLPCAAGRIPGALAPASDGSFETSGSYAIQVGPVSINGPVWRPALYSGQRTGDHIQLFITLADATRIGPFGFELGVVKMFPRCL